MHNVKDRETHENKDSDVINTDWQEKKINSTVKFWDTEHIGKAFEEKDQKDELAARKQ